MVGFIFEHSLDIYCLEKSCVIVVSGVDSTKGKKKKKINLLCRLLVDKVTMGTMSRSKNFPSST